MKSLLLTAALAAGVCATTANVAQAARDPDVNKTLQRAYPDTRTEITGNETINGVKVYNVNVTDKRGTSSAQVTEFGDFLNMGVPQQEKTYVKQIQSSVGKMFPGAVNDVQVFRSTTYLIDAPVEGQKGQTYQIRIDPVGRVIDIKDAKAMAADRPKERKQVDDAVAKKLEQIARDRYVGKEKELQRVTESDIEGFYEVDFKGAAVTLNEQGQILQIREDLMGKDMPLPVRETTDQLVKAASRAQRVEQEYLQFTQPGKKGDQVVVKMRPDGDIINVVNQQAQQEEQAVTAKHKQGATAQPQQKKAGT